MVTFEERSVVFFPPLDGYLMNTFQLKEMCPFSMVVKCVGDTELKTKSPNQEYLATKAEKIKIRIICKPRHPPEGCGCQELLQRGGGHPLSLSP